MSTGFRKENGLAGHFQIGGHFLNHVPVNGLFFPKKTLKKGIVAEGIDQTRNSPGEFVDGR